MTMKFLVVLGAFALHIALVFSGDAAAKLGYIPQVAFICNKPAMHMTPSGSWEADANTGCLNQPKDILDYCKKLYPGLDVTNVMESPEPTTIANWCRGDQKTCSQSHIVYPYRCLVGQFESEPLLVPEHCQFDHVHDSSQCLSEATWHGRAFEECGKKLMLLQSSSMLMPCGTELFSGVEFVCCPKSKSGVEATSAPVILKSDGADAAPRSPTDPMQNFGNSLSTAGENFDSDEDSDDEDDDDEVLENQNADSILSELKAGNVGPVIVQQSTTAAPKANAAPKGKGAPKAAAPVDPVPASSNNNEDDDDDDDYEDDDDDYFNEADVNKAATTKAPAKADKKQQVADDTPLWRLYLAGDLAGTEHEFDKEQQLFEEVMVSWRADFSAREQQLKKDWEEAKANVKQTAGDQSTLNAVSDEFRRSFNTLKDQGANEHIRLLDIHDQRIQTRLLARQKEATKRLTAAIQNAPADAEEVADYLEDLIDIEEKQKKHAVNYYSKLRNIQPASADKALDDLKMRIRRVEDQLKQSMDLLKKLPEKDVNKIKPEITAYLKTYQDVEDAASLMMRLIPSQVQQAASNAANALGVKLPNVATEQKAEQPAAESSEEDDDDEPALGLLGRPDEEDDDDDFDSEEDGAGIDVKPKLGDPSEYNSKIQAEAGAMRADRVESSADSSSTIGLSTALVIGSAIAAAFLLILVAGLLVYRTASRRKYAGRMLVTTAISPEERHVVNMQSNGYENPTYKYFYEVHA